MRVAPALLLAWLALGAEVRGEPAIGSLEFLGLATIPTGTEHAGTVVGGLSGITWDPRLDRYYAITDDPSLRAPSRVYTLRIALESGRPELEIEGVTLLTDRKGRHFEERVIDGEGIALTPRRTLLVSSEGNVEMGVPPSIREFRLDGREIRRYRVPRRWLAKKREPHGVRHNAAFEALALPPHGRFFVTATESALHQDGPAADVGRSSRSRLSRFDLRSGKHEADFVYVVDPVVSPPPTPDAFRVNGLVELIALSDTSFLALERSFTLGVGNSIRLFLVSTAGARNVRKIDRLEGRDDVAPVSKRLLVDLADLELEIDNVEGMALGPRLPDGRRSLVLVSDDNFNPRQTTQVLAFALAAGETPPAEVQGRGHRSPLEGRWLAEVRGVVTAVDLAGRRRGFWIQDSEGDGDDATSEGLFVAPRDAQARHAAGDLVSVGGRVLEVERPGQLPVTRLSAHRVELLDEGAPLPPAVALGGAGRPVPAGIDDDGLTSFDVREDAIDVYESLEGMRVAVGETRVVGPTTRFGTFAVEIGGREVERTARGGLLLDPSRAGAAALIVDASLAGDVPELEVGQDLAAPLTGVLDYDFGGYRLVATAPIIPGPAPAEPAPPSFGPGGRGRLTVATHNVENLDAGDSHEKFDGVARRLLVGRPELIALQEIQDDSGTADDGVVTATATLGRLVEAVRAQGGPSYRFLQLDPADNADGGAPGGNIRVAFLYDPARLRPVESGSRLGDANPVRLFGSSPAFGADPERGFEGTRKPLAAELELDGRRLVAINVHLKSKRGDDPPFGSSQPPVRHTEEQRLAQAEELGAWVGALLEADPGALVMVLGDFNELEDRPPMRRLAESGLTNLLGRVDVGERYTYNFAGYSQAIDHVLVSPALAERAVRIEILHLNADYPHSRRASDHDGVLASFDLAVE